jgi:hypothetical protein
MDSQTMKTPIPTLRHLPDILGELIAGRGRGRRRRRS